MKQLLYIILICTFTTAALQAEAWYSTPLQAQELMFGNALKWTTIFEINLQQFVVEKSNDGSSFDELGTLEASSFSMVDKSYHFMDVNPLSEVTYYRLKEIGVNGKFSYSQIITVEKKQLNELHMLAMSNVRAAETFVIKFDAIKDLKATCLLKNYKGDVLDSFTKDMKNGLNEVVIDLKQRQPGLYFIQVINAGEIETFMVERTESAETKLPPVADARPGTRRN